MKAFRKASGGWTAHLALLLLLAQLFATGFTGAAHAAAPQLDAFGNVLCIGGGAGDGQDGGHSGLHECCTFGCNSVSSAVSVPPQGVPVSASRAVAGKIVLPFDVHSMVPGRLTRPGSPRAPPSAV